VPWSAVVGVLETHRDRGNVAVLIKSAFIASVEQKVQIAGFIAVALLTLRCQANRVAGDKPATH
jgi:hypothetical protein